MRPNHFMVVCLCSHLGAKKWLLTGKIGKLRYSRKKKKKKGYFVMFYSKNMSRLSVAMVLSSGVTLKTPASGGHVCWGDSRLHAHESLD